MKKLIVPEGALFCENCGRILPERTGGWHMDYFCIVCDRTIPNCESCYGKKGAKTQVHLEIKHDRENHFPFYSIDIS